jgi:hypothetical protein
MVRTQNRIKTDGGTYGLADKTSLKVLSSEIDPAEIRLIR